MIKVGLLGGRGYVGGELLSLLQTSPDFHVAVVGSSTLAGRPLQEEFPDLVDSNLRFTAMDPSVLSEQSVDVWVLALSNGEAARFIDDAPFFQSEARGAFDSPLFERGARGVSEAKDTRLLDISADYRFDDQWVYGLPERNAQRIAGAKRVSNPGCYATGTQLALLPVLDQLVAPPTAFGVSGFSGAGKKPSERNDPARLDGNLLPYQLTDHTHECEVSYQLGTPVHLMPHVAQFFRGISLTISVQLSSQTGAGQLLTLYKDFYRDFPLVEITPQVPDIQSVRGTNICRIGGFELDPRDPSRFVVVSVLDNLRKGAASQALQNLNLMFGIEPTKGLVDG